MKNSKFKQIPRDDEENTMTLDLIPKQKLKVQQCKPNRTVSDNHFSQRSSSLKKIRTQQSTFFKHTKKMNYDIFELSNTVEHKNECDDLAVCSLRVSKCASKLCDGRWKLCVRW